MNMIIGSVNWASFEYFWLGILVGVSALLLMYRTARVRTVIKILTHTRTSRLLHNFSWWSLHIKTVCMLVGLLFLYAGLLRPQWKEEKKIVAQEGRDLFIALDISRSMLVADCQPNRLAYAKKKIYDLLQLLQGARVGLILFSGSAFVQCPLTDDYAAFNLFLDSVDVESISSGSTSLESAIAKVADVFESMPAQKSKLLVLFTDGEDFSRNLTQVKERALKAGLSIFTVGIGTSDGGPIPLYDLKGRLTGHQKDTNDKVVISRMNVAMLQKLAEDIGGTCIAATPNTYDMQSIAHLITKFEKEKYEDRQLMQAQEQYPYFLFISLLFFIIEWLL